MWNMPGAGQRMHNVNALMQLQLVKRICTDIDRSASTGSCISCMQATMSNGREAQADRGCLYSLSSLNSQQARASWMLIMLITKVL